MVDESAVHLAFGLLGPPVRYFAKRSGGRVVGGSAPSSAQLVKLAKSLEGWDFYVALNPVRERGVAVKASTADVTTWRWMLVDIDPVSPSAVPLLAAALVRQAGRELISGFESAAVELSSGRGVQLWVRVQDYVLTTTEERREVESAMAQFLRRIDKGGNGCRIDTSCSDLARVARCPGTVNQKSGRLATFSVVPAQPIVALSPHSILSLAEPEELAPPPIVVEGAALPALLPHLTRTATRFLTEGVQAPGRHAAAYAAAAALRDLKVSEGAAASYVVRGGSYCRPPLPPSASSRACHNAYMKGGA